MSANGGQPPVILPPGPAGLALVENERLRQLVALLHQGVGTGQQPGQQLEQQAEPLDVEAIIKQLPEQPPPQYGEMPGIGYLYADTPEKRQQALVRTTPEFVRDALLRAIEVGAMNSMLPFSEHTPAEHAKAALAFSQAYLLLDPEVDQQGVPVGAQAAAEGQAQEGAAHANAEAQKGLETHKTVMQGHLQAHASGQTWEHPVTQNGYAEPPRVLPNPAEKAIGEKHKSQSQELKGARGDLPRPKPRVGQ